MAIVIDSGASGHYVDDKLVKGTYDRLAPPPPPRPS